MKDTVPTKAELKRMTQEQLWAGLREAIKLTEHGLRLAAIYWVELKERGQDLSKVDVPWSSYFPAVAEGKLDPRLILSYGWHEGLLSTVASLVPEDQAKIANPRDKVPLLVPNASGNGTHTVMRAPAVMKMSELQQVFGDGRIRTPDEQRKHVQPLPNRKRSNDDIEDTGADLDLFNALTPQQREQVRRYAATRHPPVAFVDLVVRWAVQRGACKETPAPARQRREVSMASEARV
jgi:hypothetical protein